MEGSRRLAERVDEAVDVRGEDDKGEKDEDDRPSAAPVPCWGCKGAGVRLYRPPKARTGERRRSEERAAEDDGVEAPSASSSSSSSSSLSSSSSSSPAAGGRPLLSKTCTVCSGSGLLRARKRARAETGKKRPTKEFPGWVSFGPTPPGDAMVAAGALAVPDDEELCALSGHWKIFQKIDRHRYSTDDVVREEERKVGRGGRRRESMRRRVSAAPGGRAGAKEGLDGEGEKEDRERGGARERQESGREAEGDSRREGSHGVGPSGGDWAIAVVRTGSVVGNEG